MSIWIANESWAVNHCKSGVEAPSLHWELALLCSELQWAGQPFLSTEGCLSLASVPAAVFGALGLCTEGFLWQLAGKARDGGHLPCAPRFYLVGLAFFFQIDPSFMISLFFCVIAVEILPVVPKSSPEIRAKLSLEMLSWTNSKCLLP